MIIIASTGKDEFLVKMSENEIANIAGYAFASSANACPTIAIGTKISVHEMWTTLHIARDSYEKIAGVAKELHSHSEALKALNLNLSNPFEEIKK